MQYRILDLEARERCVRRLRLQVAHPLAAARKVGGFLGRVELGAPADCVLPALSDKLQLGLLRLQTYTLHMIDQT